MDQVGLVTSIRYDQLLLLSKENANFAPPNRRPCPLYMLSYHRDRILAAAQEIAREIPNLEGDRGLDAFAAQIHAHVAGAQDDDEEALKVCRLSRFSNGLTAFQLFHNLIDFFLRYASSFLLAAKSALHLPRFLQCRRVHSFHAPWTTS